MESTGSTVLYSLTRRLLFVVLILCAENMRVYENMSNSIGLWFLFAEYICHKRRHTMSMYRFVSTQRFAFFSMSCARHKPISIILFFHCDANEGYIYMRLRFCCEFQVRFILIINFIRCLGLMFLLVSFFFWCAFSWEKTMNVTDRCYENAKRLFFIWLDSWLTTKVCRIWKLFS